MEIPEVPIEQAGKQKVLETFLPSVRNALQSECSGNG